ncbi:hypothetical protein [Luteipulveratus mongoliensis]|uniref:Uncharacterized protein n=1 Tax=Luteipulveratus mongoliensis TaxID=571913 RepID=A0A0K1JHU5_9MICO|nr:hypothetical protein [Luteipulveratus mongoliensis]AKU16165.1 hypothetical protein VV02_10320 [Luteipulveratus mongoliensis]
MPSRLLTAGAILLIATGAALGAHPAYAADPVAPFTVQGTPVELNSASGSAPELKPGLSRTTLPTDTTSRFGIVKRSAGESLVVTVSGFATEKGQPYFSTDDHELSVKLKLADENDTSCGSTISSSNSRVSKDDNLWLLSTTAFVDAADTDRDTSYDDKCATATSFLVEVTREAPATAQPLPAEILVSREPKATGTGTPATAAQMSELVTQPKAVGPAVAPGHGFSDAPTLKPGGYPVTLCLGETVYYRVRLEWGQRLGASVQLPQNGSQVAVPVQTTANMTLWTPQRVPIDPSSSSDQSTLSANEGDSKLLSSFTAPVAWGNRTLSYKNGTDATGKVGLNAAQWTDLPGWYYVSVTTVPFDAEAAAGAAKAKPLPATVTIDVQGQPTKGPSYVNAGNQPVAEPAAGRLSVGSEKSGDGSSTPWARIGGGVLVVLLAAAAVAWALRARRRTS